MAKRRAGARGAVPDRHDGDPGDPRLGQLRRRVLHPQRRSSRRRSRSRSSPSIGVALAAFYALRLYQRTMHNRLPEGVESREITLARGRRAGAAGRLHRRPRALPGLILDRGEASVEANVAPVAAGSEAVAERSGLDRVCADPGGRVSFDAPDIDYAGLSPVIALTAGTLRRAARPASSARSTAARWSSRSSTLGDARGHRRALRSGSWGEPDATSSPGALRIDDLALAAAPDRDRRGGLRASRCSWREEAADRRGRRPRRVPRAAARLGARHGAARPGAEPDQLLRRARAALDPALRALRLQRTGASARSSPGSST